MAVDVSRKGPEKIMKHEEKRPVPAGVLWTEEGVSFSVAVPKGKVVNFVSTGGIIQSRTG